MMAPVFGRAADREPLMLVNRPCTVGPPSLPSEPIDGILRTSGIKPVILLEPNDGPQGMIGVIGMTCLAGRMI